MSNTNEKPSTEAAAATRVRRKPKKWSPITVAAFSSILGRGVVDVTRTAPAPLGKLHAEFFFHVRDGVCVTMDGGGIDILYFALIDPNTQETP